MKKIFSILLIAALSACSKSYLDVAPKATLSQIQVSGDYEGLVTAAYASLGNDHYNTPWSLWPYGDVRAGDAYKGGRDEADIQNFYFLEIFKQVRSDIGEFDGLWFQYYVAISRVNAALTSLNALGDTAAKKKVRQAEMRFLRGHWYFQLKVLFKNIPFIDETVPTNEYANVLNTALTNDALWQRIADDFKFAADNLPTTQPQIGRANKYAALAYLAKTKLYQAYEQDEKHNVTKINTTRLNEVVALCDQVIAGPYALESDFANNFMLGTENGPEAIFSVQYSKDDGTMFGRLNFGDVLGTPQGIGCCDFRKPSQNLVNSFKTSADGLPEFNSFNNSDYVAANTVDPRLNHTVAMPGHPWKYDAGLLYQESWNRTPDVYGVYASLKENVKKSQYVQVGPFYASAKNRILLRFADVMLWKAEALIELGRQNEALPLINALRNRSKNSTNLLKLANGDYESKFAIDVYKPGVNCDWTKDFARQAMRFERRLEFAMEGMHFFDLVRWGIAESYMNAYFAKEKDKRKYLKDASFQKNRDEYLPIPLNQIRFSRNQYVQNPGYLQ
ncbi:MAG: RagB/SusD family nutrient uptake outer membrane protein [Bacteroidetes bacterium]|uniref:RagB/SusD family nutrient uptake outer membrane protein n=1 Tax=Phnomibacter sp. TaxID=2836217 RepID=UPI002FDECAFA|nr:RagB/SusD family nutrient uptake outer membrane protein [Bacteroidota bacterium]